MSGIFSTSYRLAFEVSPIILSGGIAPALTGGLLPIIALYGQSALLSVATNANQFFATYLPLPGSTLIANRVATVPFANQQVAGNSIIQDPLTLSMLMIAPVNTPGGYLTKLATFTSLQNSLQQHCQAAGTFYIATPAFIYGPCIMTGMSHLGTPEGKQQQIEYQLDFVQPLLTAQAAQAAMGRYLSLSTSGGRISGVPSWSPTSLLPPVVSGLAGAVTKFGGNLGN
jgi:hypothetical protein